MKLLNKSQENAMSIFMDKYGTDAGAEVIAEFERTGSLGRAMLNNKHRQKAQKYPVFCAWCHREIGKSEVEHSHGICKNCAEKMLVDLRERTENKEKS